MLFNIYFSAKGTTQKCADYISGIVDTETVSQNLLNIITPNHLELAANDVLILSMPVYGGYIPHHCIDMVKQIKGKNTPAIILAVFGNRHFDNALIQMQDLVEANGFKVIAAGAFLAEHSIFPSIATGRPDAGDYGFMKEFAEKCRAILSSDSWHDKNLTVPGLKDYDPSTFKGVPFHPDGNNSCTNCQKCVNICPMQAISSSDPKETDDKKCISCGACISYALLRLEIIILLPIKQLKLLLSLNVKRKNTPLLIL